MAVKQTYAMVIEWADGNYSGFAPDVPGCVTTGATPEEVTSNMREALSGHLELLHEYGEPIPAPRASVALVEVDTPLSDNPTPADPWQPPTLVTLPADDHDDLALGPGADESVERVTRRARDPRG